MDSEFIKDDADVIDYDLLFAVKDMKKKEITNNFLSEKKEAKSEFFYIEPEFET